MSDQTNDPITAKFGDRQPPNSPEAQIQRIDDRIRDLHMWADRAVEDLTARVDKLQERFDHRDESFHKHLVYLEKRDAILAHLESETDRLCHRVREMDDLTNTDDFRGMMAGLGGGRRDKKDSESSKPESAKAHSGREEPADDAHEALLKRIRDLIGKALDREPELAAMLVSPKTWQMLFPGKRGPEHIDGLPVCALRGLPDAESAKLHDILAASFLVRRDSPLLWLVRLDTTEQLMLRVYHDAVPWFAKEEATT